MYETRLVRELVDPNETNQAKKRKGGARRAGRECANMACERKRECDGKACEEREQEGEGHGREKPDLHVAPRTARVVLLGLGLGLTAICVVKDLSGRLRPVSTTKVQESYSY